MLPDRTLIGRGRSAVQPLLFKAEGEATTNKTWRPIHYLGSKLRLIEPIIELLDNLDPTKGTVCDLFAGSGTVSQALANSRTVVAADIQEYSRTICAALLEAIPPKLNRDKFVNGILETASEIHVQLHNVVKPLVELETEAVLLAETNPQLLCSIVEDGSLMSVGSESTGSDLSSMIQSVNRRIREKSLERELTATRYFGGLYFAYGQAVWLDALSEALLKSDPAMRNIGIGAVLSTASDVVNTVGKQFAQPIRPRTKSGTIKNHLIRQICRDRTNEVKPRFNEWITRYLDIPRCKGHQVIRGDFREVLQNHCTNVSVIYADPPYTRDHYSRFYHVLETLSLRDSPQLTTTLLNGTGATSRGIYRGDRHQSPFCIKSQAPEAFDSLFEGAKKLGVPMVCSYSPFVKDGHPRLMTVDAILSLAKRSFSKVDLRFGGGVSHSKLNKTELKMETGEHAEVFIVCH